MHDHKQLFFGLNQAISFSNLTEEIKRVSNHSINDKGFMNGKFSCQDVYDVFPRKNHPLIQIGAKSKGAS